MKKNIWQTDALKTVTFVKKVLANLSVKVRSEQYKKFEEFVKPNKQTRVLDVGVTSDETLKDSNLFERLYKYQDKLVAATVEDPIKFKKLYPNISVRKIYPNKKLPFKDKSFDAVVAWATLEHVGDYQKQEKFINELTRVGKKVFLTTPYRGCIYEPHSGLFFIHMFSLKLFRVTCRLVGKKFWAYVKHLNPLYVKDIYKMNLKIKPKIMVYKLFGILPSHLLIFIQK